MIIMTTLIIILRGYIAVYWYLHSFLRFLKFDDIYFKKIYDRGMSITANRTQPICEWISIMTSNP